MKMVTKTDIRIREFNWGIPSQTLEDQLDAFNRAVSKDSWNDAYWMHYCEVALKHQQRRRDDYRRFVHDFLEHVWMTTDKIKCSTNSFMSNPGKYASQLDNLDWKNAYQNISLVEERRNEDVVPQETFEGTVNRIMHNLRVGYEDTAELVFNSLWDKSVAVKLGWEAEKRARQDIAEQAGEVSANYRGISLTAKYDTDTGYSVVSFEGTAGLDDITKWLGRMVPEGKLETTINKVCLSHEQSTLAEMDSDKLLYLAFLKSYRQAIEAVQNANSFIKPIGRNSAQDAIALLRKTYYSALENKCFEQAKMAFNWAFKDGSMMEKGYSGSVMLMNDKEGVYARGSYSAETGQFDKIKWLFEVEK